MIGNRAVEAHNSGDCLPEAYCPGCGQANVTVGLDSVLREIRPVFRNHACNIGAPGSTVIEQED